jgi:death-on-curing protein
MRTPIWVPRTVICAIHQQLLARFGGLSGIRDEALLESALARPENLLAYGEPSLFELATAYAHGIMKNHPFLDGNKRIGFMAAYVFLGANGLTLAVPEEEVVAQTLALAASECTEAEYAAWLESSCET